MKTIKRTICLLLVWMLVAAGIEGIQVKAAGTGKFAYPQFTMMKGEKLPLQFTDKRSVREYTWRSSDAKTASVSKKGVVKAKKVGTAVITGTKGNESVTCNLTIKKKPKSIIYLTFDDGPSRYSTPKILKILKKNNVKATFFELKPAKKDYDLTQRILDEGHTLAIHGYQHKYEKVYQSDAGYRRNLDKLQALFYSKFGVWCTLSRFPGGSSNTVSRHYNKGIMTRLSKKVGTWGYKYFDWNVSSSDAGGAKNAGQVFRSVKSGLVKGRENVILMHDFSHNDKTIRALDRVIKYGKKKGFVFKAMTAATTEVHHGINN